jgi:hypothetical protein
MFSPARRKKVNKGFRIRLLCMRHNEAIYGIQFVLAL